MLPERRVLPEFRALPEVLASSPRLCVGVLSAGIAAEALLLASLVGQGGPLTTPVAWIPVHVFASLLAAVATTGLVARLTRDRSTRVFVFCLVTGLIMPFVGGLGVAGALWVGMRQAAGRHRESVYWHYTDNPDLPFTPPVGRVPERLDSRGFIEMIEHDQDADALYRKVLAAGRMRTSLSVDALNAAITHADDRIRLTAYQTLDQKVTRLNSDIQRLETQARNDATSMQSDTWLQIASHYWELLTLEQGEPVARRQLLSKAATAARRAIVSRPDNRNAHFTFGRIALRQGKPVIAAAAFERALRLGMPAETVVPYLAEAAFDQRDFPRVAVLLKSLDEAFKRYPPLRQLTEQWA